MTYVNLWLVLVQVALWVCTLASVRRAMRLLGEAKRTIAQTRAISARLRSDTERLEDLRVELVGTIEVYNASVRRPE